MDLAPYLVFDGRCEEAFRFYEQNLGGRIVVMTTFGESPMAQHAPPEWHAKILHARLVLGDNVLMGSDAPPGRHEAMQGFSVTLTTEDPAEAERVFLALAEEGTIRMQLQETFWAQRFGMLVDRFGTPWMVNCEKPRAP